MEWLDATEGGGHPPSRDAQMFGDTPIVAGPLVLAYGTVGGIPWQVDAAVTGPTADGAWWDQGPVGPSLAFALGHDGWFGGGGGTVILNEGTHLMASGHFFGSRSHVVAWIGIVSANVATMHVRLDDGDVREVELHDVPLEGFDERAFWCFPPRSSAATIVAYGTDGRELQREQLIDVDVHPQSNAGTSVNAYGWREDRPPAGWPQESRTFAPGEGPRRGEDLYLHEADFPLYVIPPRHWAGACGLAGAAYSGGTLTQVSFVYHGRGGADDVARGFTVVNDRGQRWPFRREPRQDDVGIWWDERTEDTLINVASRYLSDDEAALRDVHGRHAFGAVRLGGLAKLTVDGVQVTAALREYRRVPEIRELRLALPPTEVALVGWNVSFEELRTLAIQLERIELATELFTAMMTGGETAS